MQPARHDLIGAGWAYPPRIDAHGVALANGEEEIVQSIQIILSTPVGSRIMRPEFGSRIHELVFAPINGATCAAAATYVEQALGYWEPRIDVTHVAVRPDPKQPEALEIMIEYTIRSTLDERSLVAPFYTIPTEA